MLNPKEQKFVLQTCRETIQAFLENRSPKLDSKVPRKILEKKGVFVTLTINGHLRGCMGNLEANQSIWEGIQENALSAAFNDSRFPPLSEKEFENTHIEVSILSKPEPREFHSPRELLQKLVPEKHGVILQSGFHKATFLPSVWEELPDKVQFLSHLCMKAGLEPSAWQESKTKIWLYEANRIEE